MGVLSAHAVDLLPIDVDVGTKGDALSKVRRKQEQNMMKTLAPDWKPWVIVLIQNSSGVNPRLIGSPMNLEIRTSGDSVVFLLTPEPVVLTRINWPKDKFHLFIVYGNDYAQYEVETFPDSTAFQTIKSSWFVETRTEMKLTEDIVLLQLLGNLALKLSGGANKLFKALEKEAEYIVLDQGYYKDFPDEILINKKKRSKAFNYTANGRLLAFKVSSEHRDKFNSLINDYNSSGEGKKKISLVSF